MDLSNEFKKSLDEMLQYRSQSDEKLKKVFEIWYKVCLERVRIYSILSSKFLNLSDFNTEEKDQETVIFIKNLDLLSEIAKNTPAINHKLFDEFIEKIRDHMQLINIQVNEISGGITNAVRINDRIRAELESNRQEINKLKEEIGAYQKKFKETEAKSKSLQKDFIAILGIFASILIAAFGGLTGLSTIFTNIKTVQTGKLLLTGSFLMLSIVLIIFLLLNGIAKLTRACLKTK